MINNADIYENDLIKDYGQDVLNILLTDYSVTAAKADGRTHNIFWQQMITKNLVMPMVSSMKLV